MVTSSDNNINPNALQAEIDQLRHQLKELEHEAAYLRMYQRRAALDRQLLHDLFMQAPAAVAILYGPDLNFELVNPHYYELVGPERALLGKSLQEALPELKEQGYLQIFEQVYHSGRPFIGNEMPALLNRNNDSTLIEAFFNFIIQPLRDNLGKIEGIFVHAVDVTDQVRARNEAEQLAQKLEILLESMPDAIFIGDKKGIQRANQRALDLLGFDNLEDIKLNILDLAARVKSRRLDTGEPVQESEMVFSRALTGESGEGEFILYNARLQADVIIRISGAPYYLEGQVAGAIAILTDITAQKQAQEALRASEEFKNRMLESSRDCIKVLDLEGHLIYINPSAKYILEVEDLQICLHTDWLGYWQAEDKPRVAEALRRAREGQSDVFQAFCPTFKGTPKWWEVIVTPIHNAQGEVVELLAISRDITVRKQAEITLRELNQLKDLFLSITGHELRSPLTAIKGYASVLQNNLEKEITAAPAGVNRRKYQPKMRRPVDGILYQAGRMNDMINELLEFSRVETRQLKLAYKPGVDLSEMLNRVIEQHRFSTTDHTLVVEGNNQPMLATVDESRVEQVLDNLVSNAIKYSPANTTVTVDIERAAMAKATVDDAPELERRAGGEIIIRVHDQGDGISLENQRKIFDRFYRVQNNNSVGTSGLGLGLYVSYEVVKAHQGRMWVESEPGTGSIFYVALPVGPGPQAVAAVK